MKHRDSLLSTSGEREIAMDALVKQLLLLQLVRIKILSMLKTKIDLQVADCRMQLQWSFHAVSKHLDALFLTTDL